MSWPAFVSTPSTVLYDCHGSGFSRVSAYCLSPAPLTYLRRSHAYLALPQLSLLFLLVSSCVPLAAQNNPVPFLHTPLSPASAAPGAAGFTLTVNGAGFVNGAVVNWNGSARPTAFVSSGEIDRRRFRPPDLAVAGTIPVTVSNPAPGGGTSNAVLFEVATPATTLAFNRTDSKFSGFPGQPRNQSAFFPGSGLSSGYPAAESGNS